MPQVETVNYVSQPQAYTVFRSEMAERAVSPGHPERDLPVSLEIKLRNPSADYQVVASAVTGGPGWRR